MSTTRKGSIRRVAQPVIKKASKAAAVETILNATAISCITANDTQESLVSDTSTVTTKSNSLTGVLVQNGTNKRGRGPASVASTTTTDHVNGEAVGEVVVNHVDRPVNPGFALAMGENLSNQLGLGPDIDNRKKPQIIKDLPENVIQVASGGMHSACLTEDGIVYTFGCNDEFALGRDNEDDIEKVELPEKCVEVTAGDSHTAALSDTGVVYAWGTFRDGNGVLGLEEKQIAKKPMRFKLRDRVVKISSGADHLVFLTVTGEVYTAGNSEHGQLGRISKYNSYRGGRRGSDMIIAPGLVRIGKTRELKRNVKFENVWTTAYCTFLQVKDSDLIIGFGLNNCYQLGIEDAENRYQPEILHELKFEAKLKKIVGGMHHTVFLDVKGNVYTMGSHRYGCLGLDKIEADVNAPTKVAGVSDIIDIAANTNVTIAISKSGKAYSWGTNYSKQLGLDTEDDYWVPTLVKSKQLDVREVFTASVGGQHSLLVAGEESDMDTD